MLNTLYIEKREYLLVTLHKNHKSFYFALYQSKQSLICAKIGKAFISVFFVLIMEREHSFQSTKVSASVLHYLSKEDTSWNV